MDKFRAIKFFVRISKLGSFTKVAEEFNLAKSIVSKEIGRLEEDLGLKLFYRSTRSLTLTPAGESYLLACEQALGSLEEAENHLSDGLTPSGLLRINAPMAMGLTSLNSITADFIELYPDIKLEVYLSDESLNLTKMGFDVALRLASMEFDSPYVGLLLNKYSYALCAGKNYFDKHPPIKAVADLACHNCFEYSYFRNKRYWPIDDGITISGNLKANNTIFMKEAIKKNQGIALLPQFLCEDELATGEFIEILPNTTKPDLMLYALYQDRKFKSPQLKIFMEFLRERFDTNRQHIRYDARL